MTITNGYATLAQLKSKLGRENDDDNDTYFENKIEDASRIIDEYCNTFFYTATLSDEKIDGFGLSDSGLYIDAKFCSIYFPAPIISITSLSENGTGLTEDTDYYVYKSSRRVDADGSWTSERKAIVISGSYGYASTPHDIRMACLEIAGVLSGLETRGAMETDGGVIDLLKNSVPKWVFTQLNKRKVPNV